MPNRKRRDPDPFPPDVRVRRFRFDGKRFAELDRPRGLRPGPKPLWKVAPDGGIERCRICAGALGLVPGEDDRYPIDEYACVMCGRTEADIERDLPQLGWRR